MLHVICVNVASESVLTEGMWENIILVFLAGWSTEFVSTFGETDNGTSSGLISCVSCLSVIVCTFSTSSVFTLQLPCVAVGDRPILRAHQFGSSQNLDDPLLGGDL